jgi:hypothetical protein
MNTLKLMKPTLLLVGSAIMFLGLNVGLGGIQTLGWQMPGSFMQITNETAFHVQDSHIRFIGGVWFGVGAVFFAGGFLRDALRSTLIVFCGLIALAGLFRLSGIEGGAVYSAAILPSLALELIGFPLLGWWLAKSDTRPQANNRSEDSYSA